MRVGVYVDGYNLWRPDRRAEAASARARRGDAGIRTVPLHSTSPAPQLTVP